ncbi:MAG TPA: hypothetical protein DCQ13_04930 [Firmicutes bacterium]|jgi:hypothetical protein|nr:hypothetical protein [Bacillota bacterium]HAN86973.1 hypothetical protein [Bacillota bacterium]
MLLPEGVTVDVLPFREGFVFDLEERRVNVLTDSMRFMGHPAPSEPGALTQVSCADYRALAVWADETV